MQKVFGVGFSKTGTTTLDEALETLGYKVCRQHYATPYTFYLQALVVNGDYDEIFHMVKYWDAFTDTPFAGSLLYEEAYKRLPDSKFILTVRDPEKWYTSLEKMLTWFDLDLDTAFESYHSNGMYGSHYFFKHIFGIDKLAGNKQKIIDHYNAYNQGVIDFFATHKADFIMLDWAKGDGWEKLCKFLDKPMPNRPFPHENKASQNSYLSNETNPTRNLIVNLHIGHPNDIESARYSRRNFADFGYDFIEISLADQQDAVTQINALLRDRRSEIFCFMSNNYYATMVTGNDGTLLHRSTGIPLVFMVHDHPLYFLTQQTPGMEGSISFVPGEHARRFILAHYPPQTQSVANTGSLTPVAAEVPDYDQFLRRKNVILAPMNLNFTTETLDSAWQHIKELPPARRAAATNLAEAALTQGTIPLHELDAAKNNGLTGEDSRASVGDQLLVLTFVKLWRRNQMIRTLIDLPILVSSEFVPADLQFKYPEKFTRLTMAETAARYRDYRFTLNAHPLLSDLLHDRLAMATALNSVCITDVNAAVERYFEDGISAIFFDYANLAEMPQRISAYLDDPARAFELTVRAAAVRDASNTFDYREGYTNLIDAVAAHWPPETRVGYTAAAQKAALA